MKGDSDDGKTSATVNERPLGKPLGEIVVGSLGVTTVVLFPTSFALPSTNQGQVTSFGRADVDWESWWVVAIGRAYVDQASWALPTFLAIVLAFYAALLGQSFTKTGAEDMQRTRNRLGVGGVMIAVAVCVFLESSIAAYRRRGARIRNRPSHLFSLY